MAQETSLKISEELDDEKGVADGFGDLADIYHEKGKLKPLNYDTALVYYFKALAIYNKLEFNTSIAEIKNEIAKIYFLKGKFKMAKEGAFLTLKVFKNVASKDEVRDNYLMLSRCDSALGNYKEAYRFYQLYNLYKDSIYEEKNDNGIIKQQIKFETDKVEKEIKTGQEKKDMLAKEEMRRQKLLRNGFMGGFGIVFLFSLVVYRQRNKVKREKKRSDELLLNILPAETAEELKATGYAEPKSFEEVTVMFTDFKNFTQASENMSAKELVQEINYCYCEFDRIISRHKIEKIKTMGDSYMCAGGLPVKNTTNATDVINAALEIQEFMLSERAGRIKNGLSFFEIRIGIHTGPVVAGIVGIKKFAYDIWGDTVNIASRMESSGEVGTVNISGSTFGFVKNTFLCTYRGKIEAKNKGMVDMYFVNREMAITV
ncbi:MAG: adenylate/guanylate cyclase domain-containing protein [Ginsengibacter sp.]